MLPFLQKRANNYYNFIVIPQFLTLTYWLFLHTHKINEGSMNWSHCLSSLKLLLWAFYWIVFLLLSNSNLYYFYYVIFSSLTFFIHTGYSNFPKKKIMLLIHHIKCEQSLVGCSKSFSISICHYAIFCLQLHRKTHKCQKFHNANRTQWSWHIKMERFRVRFITSM